MSKSTLVTCHPVSSSSKALAQRPVLIPNEEKYFAHFCFFGTTPADLKKHGRSVKAEV